MFSLEYNARSVDFLNTAPLSWSMDVSAVVNSNLYQSVSPAGFDSSLLNRKEGK